MQYLVETLLLSLPPLAFSIHIYVLNVQHCLADPGISDALLKPSYYTLFCGGLKLQDIFPKFFN